MALNVAFMYMYVSLNYSTPACSIYGNTNLGPYRSILRHRYRADFELFILSLCFDDVIRRTGLAVKACRRTAVLPGV